MWLKVPDDGRDEGSSQEEAPAATPSITGTSQPQGAGLPGLEVSTGCLWSWPPEERLEVEGFLSHQGSGYKGALSGKAPRLIRGVRFHSEEFSEGLYGHMVPATTDESAGLCSAGQTQS